jgi:pantothenate kinase-related protein Tda10
MPTDYTYQYVSPGVVCDAFLTSEAFVVGIRGPIGSGKSTACVMKLLSIAAQQPRQSDGHPQHIS